eukprot:comp9750_c0_seq1/m.4713 comp9750_c0_seq1/g.4713  ORF comp9750_c0_seq1/g.4713 comp9750_c0_seq1/m.4713 type:complete len:107 (-) comp9750_c0_seq1:42-362(-)
MASGTFVPFIAMVINVGREGIERLMYDPTITEISFDRPDLILINKYETSPLKKRGVLADFRPLIQSKLVDRSSLFLDLLLARDASLHECQYFQESQASFCALPLAL